MSKPFKEEHSLTWGRYDIDAVAEIVRNGSEFANTVKGYKWAAFIGHKEVTMRLAPDETLKIDAAVKDYFEHEAYS